MYQTKSMDKKVGTDHELPIVVTLPIQLIVFSIYRILANFYPRPDFCGKQGQTITNVTSFQRL